MRRNLPQIFRHLRELVEQAQDDWFNVEILKTLSLELCELEKQKWGPRKKKKHKGIEGEHGDGI
jgi:hypothetical protein